MKNISVLKKSIALATGVVGLLVVGTVQAASLAHNRNDVFNTIDHLNSSAAIDDLNVWVNRKSEQPVVTIGDSVHIRMSSSSPAFYTLMHVDAKGNTSFIRPNSQDDVATDYLVFPPLGLDEAVITQVGPVGEDTLLLLASKRPLEASLLGMGSSDTYRNIGKDITQLKTVINNLNEFATSNPLSIARYSYTVESNDTQYTTRSISRKVNEAVGQEVKIDFNNVNFDYASDVLTDQGRNELDGLGNALVGVEQKSGRFPVIELVGHTDSIASQNYNMELSKRRAQSAKLYLESEFGIPTDIISTVGAGESRPIANNETEDGRALNRRVEFRIQPVQ